MGIVSADNVSRDTVKGNMALTWHLDWRLPVSHRCARSSNTRSSCENALSPVVIFVAGRSKNSFHDNLHRLSRPASVSDTTNHLRGI